MKSKILKLIFILSFIPYIFLLLELLFAEYSVNYIELQGLDRLLGIIESIFRDFILAIPIIPICLTFQMCYIFRKKTKIMFLCSFIPYLFVLLIGLKFAIFGVGAFLGDTVYYGWDGFSHGIFRGFVYYIIGFPLLPICLIFQAGCMIIKLKRAKKS